MTCCSVLEFVGRTFWRVLKFIIAGLALVSAILTFTSLPCEYIVLKYIVSAVLIVAALCMVIDSAGIEAVLNKFRVLLGELESEVEELRDIEKGLNKDVVNLDKITHDYADQNAIQVGQVKSLQRQLDQQTQLIKDYTQQISILSSVNKTLQMNVDKLKSENDQFSENNKLQSLEIQKLLVIEKNAKSLIDGLMAAGDDFANFGEIIKKSTEQLEDVSTTMSRLLSEMRAEKQLLDEKTGLLFDDIDINHDGVITKDEWHS